MLRLILTDYNCNDLVISLRKETTMEIMFNGEPNEIAILLRSIKGIISNDAFAEQLDLTLPSGIKHFVDTKATNELFQITRSKRKEETP